MMEGTMVWIACGLFAAGMVCDLRSRRIPNVIPVALLGLFAVYAAAGAAGPPAALWVNFAIGAVLLAAGFALYLSGRFGAGDGKLIAIAGLWIGPADLGPFLLGIGGCALALSLYALLPFEKTRRLRSDLPFAVAIAPPAMAVMIPRALAHAA